MHVLTILAASIVASVYSARWAIPATIILLGALVAIEARNETPDVREARSRLRLRLDRAAANRRRSDPVWQKLFTGRAFP